MAVREQGADMDMEPRSYGPPPCQDPDCNEDAHVRSEYVYCLDHDVVELPPRVVSTDAVGIATEEFTYFFGASCGSSRKALRQGQEPNVMLSYATRNNQPWDGIETLMVDSGGYSLIHAGGGDYPEDDTIDDYLDYVEDVGAQFYVFRDMPKDVERTVELAVETHKRASERGIDAEGMAVLTGEYVDDYINCYHRLVNEGMLTHRLAIGALVGRRPDQIATIITAIRRKINRDTERHGEEPLELHGLGVDVPALRYGAVQGALTSADSSRYISSTRWRANRGELPPRLRDDEPRTEWYDVLADYLDMRAELRAVLSDPDPKPLPVAARRAPEQATLF